MEDPILRMLELVQLRGGGHAPSGNLDKSITTLVLWPDLMLRYLQERERRIWPGVD